MSIDVPRKGGRSTPRGAEIFGARAFADGHHKVLYYPNDDSARNAERFAAFQRRVASRIGAPASPAARALACLIAFDAPCLAELPAVYSALSRPYRVKSQVALEWRNVHGVVDRRLLSPYTILAWREQGTSARPAFEDAIVEVLTVAGFGSLGELCACAGAWMLTNVPGWLLPRIFGTGRSASLPRSALARWSSGLRLVRVQETPAPTKSVLELLDGSETSGGDDCDDELFELIATACREAPNVARHKELERMRVELLGLVPRALAAGPISCLMVWFALDLVEHGTQRKKELAPGSIEEYVRLTSRQARHLRGVRSSGLTAEKLETYYRAVLAAADEGQASKAYPACKAMHRFLAEWHDVGPWPLDGVDAPRSKPAAQAVFPTERERIWSILDDDDWSDPVRWRVRVIFAIHCSSPRRKQDAAVVRVGDIRVHEGRVVFDIDPNPLIDKALKSDASRVSVEVVDKRCARILLATQEHRRSTEGAADSDKLLGSKASPNIAWRFEACHALLLRLLKEVSGEPDVSVKSLRHTHLTELVMVRDITQRELDQLSADAGHAGDGTTLDNYGHAFEFAARRAMNASLKEIRIPSRAVASWTGLAAASVRKYWSRRADFHADVAWALVEAAAGAVEFEDVSHGHLMGEVGDLQAAVFGRDDGRVTVDLVLGILADLVADDPERETNQIAARHTCSVSLVEAVGSATIDLLGPKAWEQARFASPTVRSVIDGAPMSIDLSRARQPKSAGLLRFLPRLGAERRRDLVLSWLRVARGNGYDCSDLGSLLPLLKSLREAGVGAGQIVLAHDGSLREIGSVEGKINVLMGGPCIAVSQSPRNGRARSYVQVTEPGRSGRASRSVAGLNAVLLSLAITQSLEGKAS